MNGRACVVALALVGAILRVALGLRDLDVLDRLFLPDDTYYKQAIARALVRVKQREVRGFQRLAHLRGVQRRGDSGNEQRPLHSRV